MSDSRIMLFTDIAEHEAEETIESNTIMLDLITGECDNHRGVECDDARFYIYEAICKGHVNDCNINTYVDLYGRLLQDNAPADDEGQLLFDSIPR